MSKCQSPIIVALDFADANTALALVDKLDPSTCRLKVGKQLFVSAGPDFIRDLIARQFDVFLDLKFYDIPNTVYGAVAACCDLGIWMLTVHASGGAAMIEAAMRAVHTQSSVRPLIIAVTLLTSFTEADWQAVGYGYATTTAGVLQLAKLAHSAGADGVVSSAHEVVDLRQAEGDEFLLVTPGIRDSQAKADDQARVMTAPQALAAGANYLVIGRPITQAPKPDYALKKIMLDINA